VTNLARKFRLNILAQPEDFGGAYPTTPVATRNSFIKQRRDTARKFMRALVQGIQVYKTQREFTKKVIAKYIKVNDQDVLEDSYQFFSRLVPAKPYPTIDGIKEALVELSEGDPKARAAAPEEFADMSFVKELDDSGFIDGLYKQKK
jgi:ABC-type nitrate/sulfonate/bicarbonate transport system substrate-binding protein